MSEQPRTEAGRALLAGHYPSGVPFKEQMREYLSRSILDIEREAAARPLDVEALVWRLIQSYEGGVEIDSVQRFRDHIRAALSQPGGSDAE